MAKPKPEKNEILLIDSWNTKNHHRKIWFANSNVLPKINIRIEHGKKTKSSMIHTDRTCHHHFVFIFIFLFPYLKFTSTHPPKINQSIDHWSINIQICLKNWKTPKKILYSFGSNFSFCSLSFLFTNSDFFSF